MSRTYCFMLILLFSIIGIFFLPSFALKSFCILFLCALLFLSLAIAIKHAIPKYLFIIVFSLILPLAILDAYLNLTHVNAIYTGEKFFLRHEQIGHVNKPNLSIRRTLHFDEDFVYDATYTIDNKGNRTTPTHKNAKIAVVLMGGSFTFGQGIQDKETFAYKLAENLGENYQVINFGVMAYGPHNMLAIIEAGLPYLKKYDHILTYYTYINTHELRAAGSKRWEVLGPRYILENGKAVRKGNFTEDPLIFWESGLWTMLSGNKLFETIKKYLIPYLLPYNTLEKRMELTQAIIEKSAEEIRAINKSSKFTVLAWPPYAMDKFLPNWNPSPAIPIVDLTAWLPNSEQDMEQYRLKDIHPNALAADFVSKELTKLVKKDAAAIQQ